MGILQARSLEWVAMLPPVDLPNPRTEPRSPELQADSIPSELPGNPGSTFWKSYSQTRSLISSAQFLLGAVADFYCHLYVVLLRGMSPSVNGPTQMKTEFYFLSILRV